MSEWISVNDRLPDVDDILVTNGEIVLARRKEQLFKMPDGSLHAMYGYETGLLVTHWMPMSPLTGEEYEDEN